jgi:hypothetical protein
LLPTKFEAETHIDPGIYDHCVECHFGKVTSPFGFVFAPLSADLFLGWCTARVNAGGETPWLSATPVKFRASPKAVQRE